MIGCSKFLIPRDREATQDVDSATDHAPMFVVYGPETQLVRKQEAEAVSNRFAFTPVFLPDWSQEAVANFLQTLPPEQDLVILTPSRYDEHLEHKTMTLNVLRTVRRSGVLGRHPVVFYSVDMNVPGMRRSPLAPVKRMEKEMLLHQLYPSQIPYFQANTACAIFEIHSRWDFETEWQAVAAVNDRAQYRLVLKALGPVDMQQPEGPDDPASLHFIYANEVIKRLTVVHAAMEREGTLDNQSLGAAAMENVITDVPMPIYVISFTITTPNGLSVTVHS